MRVDAYRFGACIEPMAHVDACSFRTAPLSSAPIVVGRDASVVSLELAAQQRRVRAALAGQKPAVRELVAEATPIIQARVARVLLRGGGAGRGSALRQDVQDLTQEVLESLFANDGRTLRSWDPALGLSFANFVGLVAEREALSSVRSRRRSPLTEAPTEDAALERAALDRAAEPAEVERAVLTRDVVRALYAKLEAALSPLGMRVFRALFVEEHDVETASRELEMSPDAIYQWRTRIRQTARSAAAELEPDRREEETR